MNEIKLNKRNQERIELLERIISLISDDADNEEREDDIKDLKRELETARNFYHHDRENFVWSVGELHRATEEDSFCPFRIDEDITEAIKRMKKAEREMLQSKEFARKVSSMVHRKLEAMGVEQ